MKIQFKPKLVAIFILMTSCSQSFSNKIDFNPDARLKVVVLPMVRIDETGEIIEDEESRLLVDNLSLSNITDETPTQISRRILISTLQATNFRLIAKELIDVDLPHQGFGLPGNKVDYKKLYQVPANVICSRLQDCDAVLYGKVLKWDRTYYGVESIHEVAMEFKLVSARDNKVLYETIGADYETRGITKGPTGFSSIFIEPIQGLDKKITENVARNLVQQLFEPLIENEGKPAEAPPPAIFAVGFTAENSTVTLKNPLTILVMASSKSKVFVRVQGTKIDIPLFERSPGHYSGKYYPLETDSIKTDTLKITAIDKYRQKTTLTVSGEQIAKR